MLAEREVVRLARDKIGVGFGGQNMGKCGKTRQNLAKPIKTRQNRGKLATPVFPTPFLIRPIVEYIYRKLSYKKVGDVGG